MAKKKKPEGKGGNAPERRGARADRESRASEDEGFSMPRWAPAVLYAALTTWLFREFIFSDQMLFGNDTLGMGYLVRELYADALTEIGRVPGWAPHILGGTPFLEALSAGDSLYPPSLALLMLMEPYRALGWKLVLHVFAAGLLTFGWIRTVGGSRGAAMVAGAAYMLAPFLIGFVYPGHDGKIFVIALTPLLFWVTERHFKRPSIGTVASIGLTVALILYTTHFQMAYFLCGGVGLYAIFRTILIVRGRDEVVTPTEGIAWGKAGGMRFGLFLVGSVLGACGASYQLFPAVEYATTYSRRIATTREAAGESGRAWSASYSLHPEEVMSLIVPEFAGNGARGNDWTNGTYWGRNALKDNHEYTGLIILLLAAVSFVGAARSQLRHFLTGLGLFALLYAMGANTPVWSVLYEVLPGIRLFRANGMAAFLFGFGAITLAALGIDRLVALSRVPGDPETKRARNVAWGAAGTVALLSILAMSGVLTSIWTAVVYASIPDFRVQTLQAHLPNIVRGASISLGLAALFALFAWAVTNGKLQARWIVPALLVLVVADEARVAQPFVQTWDFHRWSEPDPNIQALLDRERDSSEPYRLWSLVRTSQDVTPAMHGIELAAGHHPHDLARYRELIGMVGSGRAANLSNANVRSLLNVRYILWPDNEAGPAPEGAPIVSRTQYANGQPYHTLIAENGLPRARLVGNAVVKTDDEAVAYIMSDSHDPSREVVLASEPPVTLSGEPVAGTVTWEERGPDRMALSVESEGAALLTVADNWFPGWKATVNGEEVPVLRAYHTLRAIPVGAGSSRVEMWYESEVVNRSFLLSVIVLLGLFAALGASHWHSRRTTLDPEPAH